MVTLIDTYCRNAVTSPGVGTGAITKLTQTNTPFSPVSPGAGWHVTSTLLFLIWNWASKASILLQCTFDMPACSCTGYFDKYLLQEYSPESLSWCQGHHKAHPNTRPILPSQSRCRQACHKGLALPHLELGIHSFRLPAKHLQHASMRLD